MSFVVITLLLAIVFGFDGPSALLAVLLAAFFIHLFG